MQTLRSHASSSQSSSNETLRTVMGCVQRHSFQLPARTAKLQGVLVQGQQAWLQAGIFAEALAGSRLCVKWNTNQQKDMETTNQALKRARARTTPSPERGNFDLNLIG